MSQQPHQDERLGGLDMINEPNRMRCLVLRAIRMSFDRTLDFVAWHGRVTTMPSSRPRASLPVALS